MPMNEAHKWLRVVQSSLISISHASCRSQGSSNVLRGIRSSPGPSSSVHIWILHNPCKESVGKLTNNIRAIQSNQSPADRSPVQAKESVYKLTNDLGPSRAHLSPADRSICKRQGIGFKSSQITEDIQSSPVSSWQVNLNKPKNLWEAHKSLRAIQSSLISISHASCIRQGSSQSSLSYPEFTWPQFKCAHMNFTQSKESVGKLTNNWDIQWSPVSNWVVTCRGFQSSAERSPAYRKEPGEKLTIFELRTPRVFQSPAEGLPA